MNSNRYVHPRPGLVGRLLGAIANSRLLLGARRRLMSVLPFLKLQSDVRDVVYLTWLVKADAVKHLVPPGVTLWQRDGLTPFTILTYAHGHFGPAGIGALRSVFPSPLQSNWRLYLEPLPQNRPGQRVVLFIKNIMSSTLYAIGTRLFSDALPTHLPLRFSHARHGDLQVTHIAGGQGSAPDLRCTLESTATKELPGAFKTMFASWDNAIDFLCLQDAAVAAVDGLDRLAFAEIDLPIETQTVRPLVLVADSLACPFVEALGVSPPPLCFAVDKVPFKVISERLL
ncbi:DUF2071 domain-containing protein [Piscinibacter terrae]|uniref:DUF2071 domain-containing protein n=1 Tax=Piscinibacter terrae TaxID=2496871 RepID=A0A3N7HPK4_9BURK|nr:DUF2071 domain-containing protein [Albitalea terrae]RQP24090.1 hypothetical protein DZC73_12210 [Albitalea terrae]